MWCEGVCLKGCGGRCGFALMLPRFALLYIGKYLIFWTEQRGRAVQNLSLLSLHGWLERSGWIYISERAGSSIRAFEFF
jgi:hypothetical protein